MKSRVSVWFTRTGAKCPLRPAGGSSARPITEAKKCAAARWSTAGTMVWLRLTGIRRSRGR